MPRPVVTFLTDFGTDDYYVSAMKAVLIHRCPEACVIDITHAVRRHDTVAGSFTLERAVASFHPGTIHLAVIDPGVGSARFRIQRHSRRKSRAWASAPDLQ